MRTPIISAGTIDTVTIQWPSGILQQFSDVSINSLLFAREPLPGDFNGDFVVDGADLTIWESEFSQVVATISADADFDFDSDGNDFLLWQRNLGIDMVTQAASQVVPEPGSGIVFLMLAMILLSWQRMPRFHAAQFDIQIS